MYEKIGGSKRLVNTLNCLDNRQLSIMRQILNYVDTEQLEQDIKALADVVKEYADEHTNNL